MAVVDFDHDLYSRIVEVTRPRTRLPLAEYAERYRSFPPGSPRPGRWQNSFVPHLMEPMAAFDDPEVEQLVIRSCSQNSKTEFAYTAISSVVLQDPGPGLVVYPTERDADKYTRNRLFPIFQSEQFRRHVKELTLKELRFDACTLYTGWANSPASLSGMPCRYLLLDEVGKFPSFAGRESNPIKLALARFTAYEGRRKAIMVSTPILEDDTFDLLWKESNRLFYHVPCVHCGRFQRLDFFTGVRGYEGEEPHEIKRRRLAFYECAHCGRKMNERDRRKLRRPGVGKYVPDGLGLDERGEFVILDEAPENVKQKGPRAISKEISGYHFPELLSPWTSWSALAAHWVRVENAGVQDRMEFYNQKLGLPFKLHRDRIEEDDIRRCVRVCDRLVVPEWARVLLAGVDVQQGHYFYVVRAFGPQARSRLIDHGMVMTPGGEFKAAWAPIQRLLDGSYRVESGGRMQIVRMNVDSGFNEKQVYRFVARNAPRTWAMRGVGNQQDAPLVMSKKIPRLVHQKNLYWKDLLSWHISQGRGDPGAFEVYNVDRSYIRQMASESRERTGHLGNYVWKKIEDRPNHFWDCEVLALIAAYGEGVQWSAEDSPRAPVVGEPAEAERSEGPFSRYFADADQPFLLTDRED